MKVGVLLATFSAGIALVLNPATPVTETTYSLYPTCGIVTEVSATEMVFTDFNGNEWAVVGDPEDWAEGDIVSAIMSDNCTPENIYDDVIVQTRYSGWVY